MRPGTWRTMLVFMNAVAMSAAFAQPGTFNYTTDSLAVAAILKANGWGMPVVDSLGGVVHCTVESVTDTANGRIVKLKVLSILQGLLSNAYGSRPAPHAKIPADIGNLTALTYFGIQANKIDSLPPEIGNLANLVILDATGNYLFRLPIEIGNLTKLEGLYLRGNLLTELPPSIGNLTELLSIQLDDNLFTQLPPEIGNWTNLQMFSCCGNSQLTTLPPEIGNLRKMWYLNLENDGLVSLPNEIGSCDSLTTFWLYHSELASLPDSIVKLKCAVLLDSNRICSGVPCPVQKWLIHEYGGADWVQWQRCTTISLPPCDSTAVTFRQRVGAAVLAKQSAVDLYDLRGRNMGSLQWERMVRQAKVARGVHIVKIRTGAASVRKVVVGP